ncbi:MAG TPA: PP2C family protein-serine/threonine phosphatase [Vicinamibacteria bacterium]|nr:PP2C family protein-serine/threonine phosphatase [Vicinamibacteria bacterium]
MATAKLLYRRLDALFGSLKTRRSQTRVLEGFLEDSFANLKEDLRLRGGLLYAERRDDFALVKAVGDPGVPISETLDPGQSPLAEVARHRVYIFRDPHADGSPQRLGLLPHAAAAGLVVGQRPLRSALIFLLDEGWQPDELDFALNTIRASLDARLVDARVRGSFREAAEIQQSLLVEEPPSFPGFELAARSVAAEEVGGDFYDFHSFNETMLGLSIGDASGHGLPAALLVRDVVTGMRMGIEKELKVAHVFEKLNRVIHRSRLSSRFVSVFYGELETDGNFVYVNAGHQPPILFFRFPKPGQPGELELTTGGTVIGPLPEARFRRGFARIQPGEVLLMLTDGIIERRDKVGEFFGLDRVRAIVREMQAQPAQAILDRLFEAAFAWSEGRPWEDDATIVVLKRNEAPAGLARDPG